MKLSKEIKNVESPKEEEKESYKLIVRSPFDLYMAGDEISDKNDMKSALLRASSSVVKVSNQK